jgi:DNA-binding NarL/FixJ family response regulator
MNHRVLALISDLFFADKVEATARLVGVPIQILSSLDSALTEVRREPPTLIIVDLNFDPSHSADAIRAVKAVNPESPTKVLAFLSHVQVNLAESAKKAGADAVVPRSYFAKNLPEILKGNF